MNTITHLLGLTEEEDNFYLYIIGKHGNDGRFAEHFEMEFPEIAEVFHAVDALCGYIIRDIVQSRLLGALLCDGMEGINVTAAALCRFTRVERFLGSLRLPVVGTQMEIAESVLRSINLHLVSCQTYSAVPADIRNN